MHATTNCRQMADGGDLEDREDGKEAELLVLGVSLRLSADKVHEAADRLLRRNLQEGNEHEHFRRVNMAGKTKQPPQTQADLLTPTKNTQVGTTTYQASVDEVHDDIAGTSGDEVIGPVQWHTVSDGTSLAHLPVRVHNPADER